MTQAIVSALGSMRRHHVEDSGGRTLRRADCGSDNVNSRIVGFIALQMDVDDESGDVQGEPVLLAKFGDLPREFSDE